MTWWTSKNSKMASGLIAAAVAATVGLASPQAQADTWKFAFEEAIDEVQGKFAQRLKAEIEANSDHSLQLYPYGTLGESDDVMEQGQAGILEFIIQSPGFTGALIPEAQVFFVPYLLPNSPEHLANFFRDSVAINDTFKGIYAEQGLELLQMFPTGEVVMTTKSPVHGPADLNEVKFRVMTNPLLVESYKAFGAVPTPLPWGEVYGSLQTNIVQGQENPTSYVWSNKLYEVTDVITFTGHNNFTTAFMANKDFFDGLSAEDQEVVQNAVDVAFEYIVEYQKGLEEESLQNILATKPEMQVVVLSEEERAPFRETAQAVEAKFIEMTGERGAAILTQMKADIAAATQ